jgi:hypothetical protein
VAREARLNPRGVRTILDRLALGGIVEVQRSGRAASVRLRDAHPLANAIRNLFQEEAAQFDRLLERIGDAVRNATPNVLAVWVAAGSTPSTAEVGVLAAPNEVDQSAHALKRELGRDGQSLAIHLTIRAFTNAERELLQASDTPITLVYGWLPIAWREDGGGPFRLHRDLDERAKRLASVIAKRIAQDPSIIDRAIEWIDERERAAPDGAKRELAEWRRLLTHLSARQIEALLVEDSEKADRLRQSLPFVDALTPEERAQLFEAVA